MGKVDQFRYLGSTAENNGEYDKRLKKKVQVAWSRWTRLTGVTCNKSVRKNQRENLKKCSEASHVILV